MYSGRDLKPISLGIAESQRANDMAYIDINWCKVLKMRMFCKDCSHTSKFLLDKKTS